MDKAENMNPNLSVVKGSPLFSLPLFEPRLKIHRAPHSSSLSSSYRLRPPPIFTSWIFVEQILGLGLVTHRSISGCSAFNFLILGRCSHGDVIVSRNMCQMPAKITACKLCFDFPSAASAHLLRTRFCHEQNVCISIHPFFFVDTRRATCPLVIRQSHTADTCYVLQNEMITFGRRA